MYSALGLALVQFGLFTATFANREDGFLDQKHDKPHSDYQQNLGMFEY